MTYPTITALPPAPSRSQSPDAFSSTAEAFVAALPTFGTEANAISQFVNEKTISVGNQFKGNYSAATTYSVGESVLYTDGKFYLSLVNSNLNNTPDVSTSQWVEIAGAAGAAGLPVLNALSGTTPTLSYDSFNYFTHTPSAATTYSFSGSSSTAKFDLIIDESGADPYKITSAILYSQFDASAQVSVGPISVGFKSDGTKMYVADRDGDVIYQYTLTTPWLVSSATYDSASFSVASQETSLRNLFFKPDGTKLYIVGDTSDNVHQYTLSTPWAISSATYDSVSFSVASQTTAPYHLVFNPSGTKMYVGSSTNIFYQYTLATPWVVSSATYDSVSVTFSSQLGFSFNSDGTSVFTYRTSNTFAGFTEYSLTPSYSFAGGATTVEQNRFSIGLLEQQLHTMSSGEDGYSLYFTRLTGAVVEQVRIGRLKTLTFPSTLETVPFQLSSGRVPLSKTALVISTSDSGASYQAINAQVGIS